MATEVPIEHISIPMYGRRVSTMVGTVSDRVLSKNWMFFRSTYLKRLKNFVTTFIC